MRHRAGSLPVLLLLAAMLVALEGAPLWAASRTVRYDAGQIREAVRRAVESQAPWPAGTVRVTFPQSMQEMRLQGEKISHEASPAQGNPFLGNGQYVVRFYDGRVFLAEQRVQVLVEVLRDVPLSARPLDRGTRLEPGDIRVVKRWVRHIPAQAVTRAGEAVGKQLGVNLAPHTEITRSMLRESPVVRKGEPVRIVYEEGPLRIVALGVCEEDGREGGLIRVRNASSRRAVHARVVGDSTVELVF